MKTKQGVCDRIDDAESSSGAGVTIIGRSLFKKETDMSREYCRKHDFVRSPEGTPVLACQTAAPVLCCCAGNLGIGGTS